jgi:glycosyltransferase involved in cell wall biosynthesis
MIRLLRGGSFDRILAFWAIPAGAWALSGRVADGIPYDCWALGADIWRAASHPVLGEGVVRVLRGAERVFADGEDLARRTGAIAGRDATFLPSFRRSLAVTPSPPPGRNRLVFIGRWETAKGADLLPDAAALLLRKGWDLEMDIWGGGRLGSRLRTRIARRGIGDRVRLRGWADPLRVPEILASADWVVIPSRQESVPLVLQDAIGAGRPVIATDVGDLGSTVRRLGAGIVVDRPTPVDLARGMAAALASGMRIVPSQRPLDRIVDVLLP